MEPQNEYIVQKAVGRMLKVNENKPTGFVYKWTNKVNNKWYIGSHKGLTDDGYIGSGVGLIHAIEKWGIDNFVREILYEGIDFRAEEEKILIALDAD